MSPPENLPTAKSPAPAKTQETGASGSGKPTPTKPVSAHGLKCPRCDSSNTKFCYYNNYSLSQPRHFCKTCRRYWTNGGALRNVPVGGGCRKNKRIKSSASKTLSYDSKDNSFNKLDISNLSLFSGLSQNVNFGLSGLSLAPRVIHNHLPQIPSPSLSTGYSQLPSSSFTSVVGFQPDPSTAPSNSLLGLNYPFPGNGFTGVNSVNINCGLNAGVNGGANGGINGGLASSIESLSHMNQDLHLKLQQQRMAMMYGGDTQNGEIGVSVSRQAPPVVMENRPQVIENRNELQPVFFRDISGPEILPPGNGFENGGPIEGTRREWFFGNSLLPVTPSTTTTTIGGGNGHGINNNIGGSNHWSDVNAWGDFQQPYSGLP